MGFDFGTQGSASTAARPCPARSRVTGLALVWFALLLLWLIPAFGEKARADGVAPRADDWTTINKDYSSQRYVDLDQITPQNVGKLKEVCEIRLNENSLFSTGLLKVGRTLYVTLSRLTYAIDAATCDLRGSIRSPSKRCREPATTGVPPTSTEPSSATPLMVTSSLSMQRPENRYRPGRRAASWLPIPETTKHSFLLRLPGKGKCLSGSASAMRASPAA